MGLRTRALLLGVASYLVSPLGFALGLGEVKLNSSLNQPLEAEIQLLQTRELTAQEILVGLGSREDFERVGVDRPFFLNDLKFTVEMDAPNGPVIRVKSNRLVREPFLNFIIQAQWPSGKLLREYTLLLDLPVFSKEPARAVQAARAQAPSTRQPVRQVPRRTTSTRRPSGTFDGNSYGPVRSSDTLWTIAESARPSSNVSVEQTMLAIQRLNPNAFINNNINLLKKGAVLRLPSEGEISELDFSQARNNVAVQNRQLSNRSAPEAQIDASRSNVERTAAAKQVKGRVKLSSSADAIGSKSGSGSTDGEQDANSLRTQLITTQEELASTQRENKDLSERVLTMDEQIKTMEKLLNVANADLRKLELALEGQADAEKASLADAVNELGENLSDATEDLVVESTDAIDDVVTDIDTVVDEQAAAIADDIAAVSDDVNDALAGEEPLSDTSEIDAAPATPDPAVIEEPAKVQPAPTPAPVKKKSLLDILMENILYIGGALLMLIAGVVAFLLTRNKRDEEDDFQFDDFDDDPIAEASDTLEESADTAEASLDATVDEAAESLDDLSTDTVFDTGALDAVDSEGEITLEGLGSELLAGSSTTPESEAIATADNHILLGEYEQALSALSYVDDTADVQLKRLEVLAKQDDLTAFDEQLSVFEGQATPEQNDQAQDLRGLIGAAALGLGAASAGIAALDTEFDPDPNDLDTTLQFDAVTEDLTEDDLAIGEDAQDDSTVLESTDNLDIDALDLDLGLDDFDGATQLDLDETVSSSLDVDSLLDTAEANTDETVDADAFDLSELDLGEAIESAADASVDVQDFAGLDIEGEAEDALDEGALNLDGLGSQLDSEVEDITDSLELDDLSLGDDIEIALDLEDDDSGVEVDLSELDLDDVTDLSPVAKDQANEMVSGETDALAEDAESALDDALSVDGLSFESPLSEGTPEALEDIAEELNVGLSEEPNVDQDTTLLDPESISFDAEKVETSLDFGLDTEIRDSQQIEEDDDELDLSNLSAIPASSDSLSNLDLSLDDDFDLSDDLNLASDDLSLESNDLSADLEATVEPESLPESLVDTGEDLLDGGLDDTGLDDLDSVNLSDTPDLSNLDAAIDSLDDIALAPSAFDSGETVDEVVGEAPLQEPVEELQSVETLSSEALPVDDDPLADVVLDGAFEPPASFDDIDSELDAEQSNEESAVELPAFDPDSDDDSEPGFLGDSDEVATKIDLLRVFVDMGDTESALNTLEEIREEGNDVQKQEAEELFAELG